MNSISITQKSQLRSIMESAIYKRKITYVQLHNNAIKFILITPNLCYPFLPEIETFLILNNIDYKIE